MAIIKSKYNIANGKDYDTHHFETSIGQVKLEDGRSLEDLVLGLDVVSKGNVNELKGTGSYLVVDATQVPSGLRTGIKYFMEVKEVDGFVTQVLYDHINSNIYSRTMYQTGFGEWRTASKEVIENIELLNSNLKKLESKVNTADKEIITITEKLTKLLNSTMENVNNHNHDESYAKIKNPTIQGVINITSNTGVVRGISQQDSKTGVKKDLISINNNVVTVGNSTDTVKVISKLTNKDGDEIIAKPAINTLITNAINSERKTDAIIESQKTITKHTLNFNSGTKVAKFGFTNGTGENFRLNIAGTDRININDNDIHTTGNLIVDGDVIRVNVSSTDKGVGMKVTGSNAQVIDYNNNNAVIATFNRTDKELQMSKNSIKLNGVRVSVGTKPSNPSTGDIYIG